ncbi:MAG: isopeptide-forming domain-containing fimbrial protein [Firmicutes bacterium]|nr:isopeptide-forming domain-containing fimbrial protein [Bacillota bacterium]
MALVIVMVMALAMMSVVAFADALPSGTKGDDKTITITPPSGVADDAINTYTVYKVFNATTDGTNISYKSLDGTAPAGFVVDDANNVYLGTATDTSSGADGEIQIKVGGATKYIVPSTADELTAEQISAIAAYTGKVEVGTVTITGTTETTVTVPDYGYYFITTSTGTVVTIDSTHKNAEVEDKNTVPTVDKKITGASSVDEDGKKALAQVGTTVNYSAEITIGNGAKGYVFHDTMETGLSYNGDAAVTGVTASTTTYTVGQSGTDTFTITFNDDYIKTLAVGTKLTVTYSATVNDNAITTDPLNNTCYVSYGDANSNNRTPVTEADVYEAKFTVTKKDGKNQPLEGAGFVIKDANDKYYKLTTTTTGEGSSAVTTNVVSWVDSIDDATEYTSDANGNVPSFTGLANGTYTLIEKTVPDGYNKAADSTFTIAEHDYTAGNLEQTAEVINNSGSELPSTGGIGTTIFYVVGAILVLGASILLVTRRRMNAK